MDNFLTICQEAHQKLGMQGTLTSVDASGYQKKIVDAISTSWRDLQEQREDYWFLKTRISHSVAAGTQTYVPYVSGGAVNIFTSAQYDRFGHWVPETFVYINGTTYKELTYMGYEDWLSQDRSTAVSVPTKFSIDPADNSVIFENLSVGATVRLEYYKSAQILVNDTDVPEIPRNVRPVIMWNGLRNIAKFFGNDDVYQEAKDYMELSKGALWRQQIPGRKLVTRSIA